MCIDQSGGRRNIYTMDSDHQEKEQGARANVRNVTIGYVVAQRGGAGGQGTRAGDQKRICFIYMKVINTMILMLFR